MLSEMGVNMKDYTCVWTNQYDFILNYSIVDGNLVLNMASGKLKTYPYSIEKEKEILEKMRQQVINCSSFRCNEKEILRESLRWGILDSSSLLVSFYIMVSRSLDFSTTGVFFIALLYCTTKRLLILKNSYENIQDYNKNELYVENEEALKDSIATYYKKRIDTSSRNIVQPKEIKSISINSMDKINYRELKDLVDTIINDRNDGFTYSFSQDKKIDKLVKKI